MFSALRLGSDAPGRSSYPPPFPPPLLLPKFTLHVLADGLCLLLCFAFVRGRRPAQLDAETDGMFAVKGFLEKAIELNPKDVFAWEQLGRVHVEVQRWGGRGANVDARFLGSLEGWV